MKRAYADIPEGQMHYRSEGEGEPLLLLHMAVGSSDEFTRLIPLLSPTYRAIAPDLLGYGDSDSAPRRYEVLDHARAVVSFMDSLGIKRASVVGHHGGSMIAVELAVNWPERVGKLVLYGTAIWRDEREDAQEYDPPAPDFTVQVQFASDGSHLLEWWRRAGMWGDNPPGIVEERVLEYIKAGPKGEEMAWACRANDVRPKLPRISNPTLVLSGTQDPFYSVAAEVKSLIPKSVLTIIENGPLYADRVMPKEYARAVLRFLRPS